MPNWMIYCNFAINGRQANEKKTFKKESVVIQLEWNLLWHSLLNNGNLFILSKKLLFLLHFIYSVLLSDDNSFKKSCCFLQSLAVPLLLLFYINRRKAGSFYLREDSALPGAAL